MVFVSYHCISWHIQHDNAVVSFLEMETFVTLLIQGRRTRSEYTLGTALRGLGPTQVCQSGLKLQLGHPQWHCPGALGEARKYTFAVCDRPGHCMYVRVVRIAYWHNCVNLSLEFFFY